MKYPDLSKAKPGDKLWDLLNQKYFRVTSVEPDWKYPIVLHNSSTCTFDGLENQLHEFPRFYWDAFEINPPESALTPPKRKEKRWVTLVPVSNDFVARHFKTKNAALREMECFINPQGPFEIEVEV